MVTKRPSIVYLLTYYPSAFNLRYLIGHLNDELALRGISVLVTALFSQLPVLIQQKAPANVLKAVSNQRHFHLQKTCCAHVVRPLVDYVVKNRLFGAKYCCFEWAIQDSNL